MAQQLRMLNEWARTKGLKRTAPKKMVQEANAAMASYVSKVPAAIDVKKHWSGTGSLQEAMKKLKGDAMYATLYRHTSAISHVSDFGAHFSLDKDGEFVWEIEPTVDGFEAPSYAARELLWAAANRIDERFGLGFQAALAPLKLTRAQTKAGKV
jgi:hypothetical protein